VLQFSAKENDGFAKVALLFWPALVSLRNFNEFQSLFCGEDKGPMKIGEAIKCFAKGVLQIRQQSISYHPLGCRCRVL
jgi:hypothetical protein